MATFYVNQETGLDTNNGSQSTPWKNWSYALQGKRLTAGDTLVLSGGVHNTLLGTAGTTDVNGSSGDIRMVGAASLGTEIQVPANLTDGMIRGAGGGVRLVVEGIKFTNPNDSQKRIGEATAGTKLAFKDCEIDYGATRLPFDSSGGSLEIIGGTIKSALSPINARRDGGVATLKGVRLETVKHALYAAKPVEFHMADCEVMGLVDMNLFVYSGASGGLTGSVKHNKIHVTELCKTPLSLYDAIVEALISGAFVIENNVFYRDVSGMDAKSRLKVYNDIVSRHAGGCRFITAKNYFVPFDSPVAEAVLKDAPIPNNVGTDMYGCGDSIVANGGWRRQFKTESGKDGHVSDKSAIGGARMTGVFWLIDDMMREHNPKYVFLQAGINDFFSKVQDDTFVTHSVKMAESLVEKIKAYGAIPVWCGCTARNATQNADIEKFNTQSKAAMDTVGVKNFSIYEELLKNPSWATDYYDSIATDVHLNAAGQTAMGKVWGTFYKQSIDGGAVPPPPPQPGDISAWVSFDGTLPQSGLDNAAPVKLLAVHVWNKVASKDEINSL